jgi:uncharacterized protein YbjT (DUF2867 family)
MTTTTSPVLVTGAAGRVGSVERRVVEEYSSALGRPVRYIYVPLERWLEKSRMQGRLPEHVLQHVTTTAKLHAIGEYDRVTDAVSEILGRPAASISETLKAGHIPFAPLSL